MTDPISARYRIEHRCPNGSAVVGFADRPTIPATVRGHLARLREGGASGCLVLVDQRYGAVVAASTLARDAAPRPLRASP